MDVFNELMEYSRKYCQLRDDAHAALILKDDESYVSLLEQWIQLIESKRKQGEHWPFEAFAKVMRRLKDFDSEINVLERFFANLIGPPTHRSDFILADRLQDAQDEKRSYVAERGTCDVCHAKNRALRRNNGGQVLCTACQRASGAKLKKDRVSSSDRNFIQKAGLEVPPDLTKAEAKRLKEIANRRNLIQYLGLPDDASDHDIDAAGRRTQFCTKVVGVTFTNSDGTSRQSIIEKCVIGERLLLVREPDNPIDRSAVRVSRRNGETIGYLGRHVVTTELWMTGVASKLDDGMIADVAITDIFPVDGSEDRILAVIIEIILTVPNPI